MTLAEDILAFWFGDGPLENRAEWFIRSDDFDADIRDKFSDALDEAVRGEHDAMSESARGSLALIILLDQFPRNLFRDDARAYATDERALALSKEAIDQRFDKELEPIERMFLYMPFQHAEDMDDQERSVQLFASLGNPNTLKFAEQHRDIIQRFGRFPHRNVDLDRTSTPDEITFLKDHGRGF